MASGAEREKFFLLFTMQVIPLSQRILIDEDTPCQADEDWDPDESVWVMTYIVGEESSYGTVYEACCQKDCRYVAKVLEYDGDEITPESVTDEIRIHHQIAKLGLAPKLYFAWIGEEEGGFIMDALTETIGEFLPRFQDLEVRKEIINEVIRVISRFHQAGFSHHDLHRGNVMVRYRETPRRETEGDEEFYHRLNPRYYLIDFGRSDRSAWNSDWARINCSLIIEPALRALFEEANQKEK